MATFLAARKAAATSSPLLKRLINVGSLRPVSAAGSSPVRSFTTDLQASSANDDQRGIDVQRRPERGVSRRSDPFTSLFSEPFDPFSPSTSINQLFNIVDNFLDTPFRGFRPGAIVPPIRRNWNVAEDEKALYLRMDMPGIDKDKVKIRVEQNTLIIQGEGEKESDEDDDDVPVRRYSSRLDLPSNLYKVGEIKAEMKNGVLKVTVPKVEEEERKDVKEVAVE